MRQSQTIKVALTGGIGTGKSTVAKMMKLLKVPVFDADKEAHYLLKINLEIKDYLSRVCPQTFVEGCPDRLILSDFIQKNISILEGLEHIMHPLIEQKRIKFCNYYRDSHLLVFEIPLLFEGGGEKDYDYTVVTVCSKEIQLRRAVSRPHMTREKYEIFSGRQLSVEEKKKRADIIIETDYSRVETFRQIQEIMLNKCEQRPKK